MAPLALLARAEAICERKFDMTFQGMVIKSKFIFVSVLLPIFHEVSEMGWQHFTWDLNLITKYIGALDHSWTSQLVLYLALLSSTPPVRGTAAYLGFTIRQCLLILQQF